MAPIKVFLASASAAMPLAKALMKELNKQKVRSLSGKAADSAALWTVVPWWDQKNNVQRLGQTIIEGLVKECKKADLAVTMLTGDDYTVKREHTLVLEPRDNCIFEAGLFMGGLGLVGERSVLVTSVEHEALPSDLQGVQYIRFPVPTPENLNDPDWCKREMRKVAERLKNHAAQLKYPPCRPVLPVLSPDALIARERSLASGGDLTTGSGRAVVINTTQPAETTIGLARQVVQNMREGVDYVYFFRADPERAGIITSLLQSVILATFMEEKDLKPTQRVTALLANKPLALTNLEEIQEQLAICFLPDKRAPLLWCVHNANDDQNARCYLRDVDHNAFYLWAEGEKAFVVASDLMDHRKDQYDKAVFYSTDYFDLYGEEGKRMRMALMARLKQAFTADLFEQVKSLCFLERGVNSFLEREQVMTNTDPNTGRAA